MYALVDNNDLLCCSLRVQDYDIFLATSYGIFESMALLGKIEQFDPEQEEWPQYVERLEQFFEANDHTGDAKADKRRATFLSVIGPAPYKLLRSLLAPSKPKEKRYEELVAKLTEHYSSDIRPPRSFTKSALSQLWLKIHSWNKVH